jgi:3-oxoacyl-[acyl-carrier protein] reductase
VLNAGIMGSSTLSSLTEEFYDSHFSTNVKGPLFLVQAAVPHMPEGGRVIFFSTGLTISSAITPNYLVYAATKGAVEQLSRVLAKELGAKGITVNAIAPGPVGTELFLKGKPDALIEGIKKSGPFGRLGEPEDIAGAVSYLAGPGARWVSGTCLRVTGAMIV